MQEDAAAPMPEEEDSKAAKEDKADTTATGQPDKMEEVRFRRKTAAISKTQGSVCTRALLLPDFTESEARPDVTVRVSRPAWRPKVPVRRTRQPRKERREPRPLTTRATSESLGSTHQLQKYLLQLFYVFICHCASGS